MHDVHRPGTRAKKFRLHLLHIGHALSPKDATVTTTGTYPVKGIPKAHCMVVSTIRDRNLLSSMLRPNLCLWTLFGEPNETVTKETLLDLTIIVMIYMGLPLVRYVHFCQGNDIGQRTGQQCHFSSQSPEHLLGSRVQDNT
jgi:hypothetical protein